MQGSSTTESASAATPTRLYSLGGGEPPPELAGDLQLLRALPPEALRKIWQVLAPSLADPITRETEELLDLFCAGYHADQDVLGRIIKAYRFLIRAAVERDVPAPALAQDLERLCPNEPLVVELILAGYEPAKAELRREMLKSALLDHGKLLVGVKWRLDSVQASEQGVKLQMPVAWLTLHYREGGETGRLTLQVLPDMMRELGAVCAKVLG